MEYRELPHGGEKISILGFGTGSIGMVGDREIEAAVTMALENGINYFDMASADASPFPVFGRVVAGKRKDVYFQIHFGANYKGGKYGRTTDLDAVKASVDWQLSALKTDYIDFGFIHCIDEESNLQKVLQGGILGYIQELKSQGVIRHIGLSSHTPAIGHKMLDTGLLDMLMFSINPAFDLLPASEDLNTYFAENYEESLGGIDPERAELYRICEQQGVGITVMKGYAGGRLFSPQTSPFGVALTPVQCIHYALTRPAVASILTGCDTPEHVKEAAGYETASEEEKDYATVLAKAPHHAYSGQCTYCGHCAPCPAQIDIAMVNKLYDLAVMQTEIPASLRAHYEGLSANAEDCIGCGGCEERCPFGVPVVERMEKAKELFK